jgi:hypothetical protein
VAVHTGAQPRLCGAASAATVSHFSICNCNYCNCSSILLWAWEYIYNFYPQSQSKPTTTPRSQGTQSRQLYIQRPLLPQPKRWLVNPRLTSGLQLEIEVVKELAYDQTQLGPRDAASLFVSVGALQNPNKTYFRPRQFLDPTENG